MKLYLQWLRQNLKKIMTNIWRVFNWNRYSITYLDTYVKGLVSSIYDVKIVVVASQYATNINQCKY